MGAGRGKENNDGGDVWRRALVPESSDVADEITAIAPMLRGILGDQIEFVLDLAEGLCGVPDARRLLPQVVREIAANARDAMPEGGVFRISWSNETVTDLFDRGPTRCCVLAMTDSGTGMDAETVKRAPEPFSTTKGREHAGLGLPQSHGLLAAMGARMTIASSPNGGTTVSACWPCASIALLPARPDHAELAEECGADASLELPVAGRDPLLGLVRRLLGGGA